MELFGTETNLIGRRKNHLKWKCISEELAIAKNIIYSINSNRHFGAHYEIMNHISLDLIEIKSK